MRVSTSWPNGKYSLDIFVAANIIFLFFFLKIGMISKQGKATSVVLLAMALDYIFENQS